MRDGSPAARLGIIAGAALLAAVSPAAAQVEIGFPPDRALVDKPSLPVEGRARGSTFEELTISVNGEPQDPIPVRDGFFAEEVGLAEGENTLRVAGQTLSVWYATEKKPAPARYRRYYGHRGLGDGCRDCHENGPKGKIALSGERAELCAWCHSDLVRGSGGKAWASVHKPVERGECLRCHTPHLSARPGLLVEDVPTCQSCHAAVVERLAKDRFVHGPMVLGDCRLCHVVHASAQPSLLVRPATALCTDCHSDALPAPGTPAERQPHTLIPEGRCGTCHEPHSSENQRMLRQAEARLCLGCHEGKTQSFHEAKGFSIYVCAKCHDLHRPTGEHLLTDTSRSLCVACHDYRGEAAFTHSFVREGECFRCHAFHEAPLGRDVALTCLGCHRGNPRLPAAHGGVPYGRSRCTACHLPHQSARGKLLRAEEHAPFAERDCAACHTERAGLLGEAWRPLCVDCHREKDLAARERPPALVHPPFRDGDCRDCHEAHDAEHPGLLRREETTLCLECHRTLRKSFLVAPKSAHGHFLEGRCGRCHDPHAAEEKHFLVAPQGRLCAGCHAGLAAAADGSPWPVPHEPVAEGRCRLCHRSHTAMNPALLKAPSPQACRPCHVNFFRTLEGAGARRVHRPVEEGRCGACHAIHGGAMQALLRASPAETCAACHPSPKGTHHRFTVAELEAKPGGSGAGGRQCLHCHRPHSSGEQRLLHGRASPACLGCHRP